MLVRLTVSGRLAKINHLHKSSGPDCAKNDFDDIIMKLPTLFALGGTKQAVEGLLFGCDLSCYTIK